jgi:predicted nucleic acid-binding protein
MVVADASAIVDALIRRGPRGDRAASMPASRGRLAAPQLIDRIWQLRETLTPYDASYIALAEALGLSLITTDRRLGRSQGHHADVITFFA